MLYAIKRHSPPDYIAVPSLEAAVAILELGDQIKPWYFGPVDHATQVVAFLGIWEPTGRAQ